MLQSEEAARRLGVKVATLYAYVSRGLLESHPEPNGRRRLFDLADIERLAKRRRGGREVETRLATITTGVTQLREDGPATGAGRPLSWPARMSFEQVAELLWQSDERIGDWTAPDLGGCPLIETADRFRWTLVMCGAADPLRADARPESIHRSARRIIAALADCRGDVPAGHGTTAGRTSIALRLADAAGRSSGRQRVLLVGHRHERRPHPHGGPRAGHLDPGRAGGGICSSGHLRRVAGRTGHHGRTAPRRRPASTPTSCW